MQISKLFMRVRGVLGLTQQISKFVDRVSPRTAPGSQAWNPFDELVRKPELADVHRLVRIDDLWGAAALFEYQFREKFPERFFEGTVGSIGGLLADVCPEAEEELITSAERLCKGRFDLLGYRDL